MDTNTWSEHRHPMMLETSIPGVFAVGDVRSGSVKRVASAVGEGAMAISHVHQFLSDMAREQPAQPPLATVRTN
jgi:thioredoxin reductase (NADPH)